MNKFIVDAVIILIPMILCLTVHEYAHALVAYWLGDDTASLQGRMTLSPISHIDPFGTLLMPLLMMSAGGGYFGWAKPVPYNPARFDRKYDMRRGTMLVALAGPAMNLLCAVLATVGFAIAYRYGARLGEAGNALFEAFVRVNVGLAIFNMLPVAPLDGSKVLAGLLPDATSRRYEALMVQGGTLLFLVVVLVAGPLLRGPILWTRGVLLGVVLPALAQ